MVYGEKYKTVMLWSPPPDIMLLLRLRHRIIGVRQIRIDKCTDLEYCMGQSLRCMGFDSTNASTHPSLHKTIGSIQYLRQQAMRVARVSSLYPEVGGEAER